MEYGLIRKIVIGRDPKDAMAYYTGMRAGKVRALLAPSCLTKDINTITGRLDTLSIFRLKKIQGCGSLLMPCHVSLNTTSTSDD
jgi:hypothetical protein